MDLGACERPSCAAKRAPTSTLVGVLEPALAEKRKNDRGRRGRRGKRVDAGAGQDILRVAELYRETNSHVLFSLPD